MQGRGSLAAFFTFLILTVILAFQIRLMVCAERFYGGLMRLEKAIESAFAKATADKGEGGTPVAKKGGEGKESAEKYPGDEGDWLVWAFRVEPKTLNQINVDGDIYSRWITTPQIFEPLMVYDFDEAELRPLLAESCEVSEDGLTITFRLRGDIYFSDGAAVTADDVIFTYETIVNPKVDAANISNLYVDVEKAIKIDEWTVKFLMKRRHFKALEILSFWDVGIYPKHIYEFADAEEFNKRISQPVGSGPYVFERWDVGQQIVLRRNERYWGRKPNIRKVIYKFIDNSVAAVQALRSGDVDIIIPEPDQFAELSVDAKFAKEFACLSYWNPGNPFYYIGWNEDAPWFGDRRVRLAMTYLIDRKEIVAKLLKGHGEVITGPYYIKGTQNDATIKPWPYDPKKAGKLLDDAGWIDSDGDGVRDKGGVAFRFRFIYSSGSTLYERLVKLLKDQMSKAGIELVAEPYEWSVLVPRLSDRQFEAMVMGWGGDIVEDNYQIFHSSQIGNRGSNYVGFNNAEADRLLEEIRRTLDVSERDKLCHRLHGILHQEQPYTFLCTRPTFRFVDRRFKNVKIHRLGLNYLEWYVPRTEQKYK